MRRILAPLLLGLAVASGTWAAGCQDDSVYRSGDPPPSVIDSGAADQADPGAGGASGDVDGGPD